MFRSANLLIFLVGDAGFEPTAFGSGEGIYASVRYRDNTPSLNITVPVFKICPMKLVGRAFLRALSVKGWISTSMLQLIFALEKISATGKHSSRCIHIVS